MPGRFILGAKYAIKGVATFRNRRELWKEAAFPLVILLLIYVVLSLLGAWCAIYCARMMNAWCESFPNWLHWTTVIFSWSIVVLWPILFIIFIGLTVSFGYEAIGGVMFDSLAAHYEQHDFGVPPFPHKPKYWCLFILDSCIAACRTAILGFFLFFLALCVPVIGPLMQICMLGYRYGLSNLSNVIFNRGLRMRDLRKTSKQHYYLVLGYGVTCYLLMLVPFLSIFFFPGLIIGGVMLYNREFEQRPVSTPADPAPAAVPATCD